MADAVFMCKKMHIDFCIMLLETGMQTVRAYVTGVILREFFKHAIIISREQIGAFMTFAVDFDGTLSFGKYPDAGPANEGLIDFLIARKSRGDRLILWTCREGEALRIAVDFCQDRGLEFDAINDNLPEAVVKYGVNSRKVSCDFYIDDRAMAGNIYKLLETME